MAFSVSPVSSRGPPEFRSSSACPGTSPERTRLRISDRYRRKAEGSLMIAHGIRDPVERNELLEIANAYLALAGVIGAQYERATGAPGR